MVLVDVVVVVVGVEVAVVTGSQYGPSQYPGSGNAKVEEIKATTMKASEKMIE